MFALCVCLCSGWSCVRRVCGCERKVEFVLKRLLTSVLLFLYVCWI